MNYWKLQIRNGETGENFVDEVLDDKRITTHEDYAQGFLAQAKMGDIVLVHKGAHPQCLVKIKYKIIDPSEIIGTSFGHDYKVEIISWYKDVYNNKNIFDIPFIVGHNGTFTLLYNQSNTLMQVKKWHHYFLKLGVMEKNINLLRYKKQIILQGPPGTGKTKLAKEIALKMIGKNGDVNLHNYLKKGLSIPNSSGVQDYYLLEKVTNNNVELSSERAVKKWSASFNKIQEKLLQLQRGETPKNKGGDDPYVLAVAKYIFTNISNISNVLENNEQFKLIQFHPSYTYEDFVRGIVAESKGDKIEYKNVNKTLGEFAELALKNYNDSKKNVNELSTEKWIDDEFNQFVDEISQTLEKDKIPLSENVDLVDLMDDAFLYIGENWKGYEHRMSFKDIKRAYLDNNLTRQDIVKNINLSGSARQHATYYIVVLKKFREFLSGKKAPTNQTKINEQKYILVIDEINRANLSSVLGELIYALEYRGEEVESMYSVDNSLLKNKLILPPNLYIIGTMNTADRSVGHIDYAIRRRFAFVEVLPKDLSSEMGDGEFYTDLFSAVKALFTKDDYQTKSDFLSQEFEPKDVTLGHSYFIDKTKDGGDIKTRWNYEIKPILLEYIRDGVLKESALEQVISIETTFDLKIQ